jgi:hypothetical protein
MPCLASKILPAIKIFPIRRKLFALDKPNLKLFFTSKFVFYSFLALLMVVLRLVYFDFQVIFKTNYVPNHDMSQGASLMATSMYSMRLTGDIAWWNPVSNGGYAQFYQSFLSPLAPTANHILFIVWAQVVGFFGWFNLGFPEYYQYLVINFLIFPFLTFLAFSYFAGLIFTRRVTIFLILLVYTLSGIGLWNSAWFYFQESASLFLLLGSIISVLKFPTFRRLLLVLIAILIQVSSLNYWTIYNSWFIAIVLGTYGWVYFNQVKRAFIRLDLAIKTHKLAAPLLAASFLFVLGFWVVINGSAALSQAPNYLRGETNFTVTVAYDRVKELRSFTTELFNPGLQRAITNYPSDNNMHNARYIGIFLIPLLALLPLFRWGRKEIWLGLIALGVLVVCLAPPFILNLWEYTPFMNRVRHTLYFYTQYWQLAIALLAGLGFERLLNYQYNIRLKQRFKWVLAGLVILGAAILAGFSFFSQDFPVNDTSLQANLYLGVMLILCSGALLQMLFARKAKNRTAFLVIFCLLSFTDLSKYFWDASNLDHQFTVSRADFGNMPDPLPVAVKNALRKTWADPDVSQGFAGGMFANMPIRNDLWPSNYYLVNQGIYDLKAIPASFSRFLVSGVPFEFFRQIEAAPSSDELKRLDQEKPGFFKEVLYIDGTNPANKDLLNSAKNAPAPTPQPPVKLSYTTQKWTFNSFDFKVSLDQTGWLYIRQLYDKDWVIQIDGKTQTPVKADWIGMVVPIEAGQHEITMDYQPLTRKLYWPGCFALEALLLVLVILIIRRKPKPVTVQPQES